MTQVDPEPPPLLEYYETPQAHIAWLGTWLDDYLPDWRTLQLFEPCVGRGAIPMGLGGRWDTNDLDCRWPAATYRDATHIDLWRQRHPEIDLTITNTPFSIWDQVLERALEYSNVGVILYLRLSAHEPLKTGIRRTLMAEHPPTAILHLPRFAYRRSPTTGQWTTDNVACCWTIWLHRADWQQVLYAPESVIDAAHLEEPAYRARMDQITGWKGTP